MASKDERNKGIDMQQAFSILPNQILLDTRLDNKSKIVWLYIQGKPKNWDFSAERIGKQLNMGRTMTKVYLKELEKFGYLVRNKLTTGRAEYYLYCPPIVPKVGNRTQADEPEVGICTVQKSHGAETDPISNKEVIVIKNNITSIATESSPFVFEDYLKQLGESKDKAVRLIGYFFKRKKLTFDSREAAQVALRRHMRAARSVVAFDNAKIKRAMSDCEWNERKSDIKWTLETVIKELTK